jgi:N-acetylglutamate synthase-like GNAT family acetyltransferase
LLRSAAVLPGRQGAGIGRVLSAAAIDHARERGDDAVYLFSMKASDYWERLGFVSVPVPDLMVAVGNTTQARSGVERGWLIDNIGWVLRF